MGRVQRCSLAARQWATMDVPPDMLLSTAGSQIEENETNYETK
jgi:hypothetical protein